MLLRPFLPATAGRLLGYIFSLQTRGIFPGLPPAMSWKKLAVNVNTPRETYVSPGRLHGLPGVTFFWMG